MTRPWMTLAAALALPIAAQAQEAKKAPAAKARPDEPKAAARPAAKTPDDEPKAAARPAAKGAYESRQALNEAYEKKFAELDKQRILDLAKLAPSLKDAEAEATYSDLFNLAVTRDQYEAAEPAAEAFLKEGKGSPQTRALASFIAIIAATNRGEYEEGVRDLDVFLKGMASSGSDPNAPKIDPNLMFAVGEATLQRLIKARKYDVARTVSQTFVDTATEPNVKKHFAERLARIDMLGKPAPAIAGKDVDGKDVSLADHQGKVVLVDFWATWAPPCVAQIPYYSALQQKYGEQGFQVVGVNVDGAHQGVRERDKVAAGVRQFLLAMRVGWPSVMNGKGDNDIAAAYGVTDIPANFLIDRDGKVIQMELSDADLDQSIQKALGGAKAVDQSKVKSAAK